MQISQDGLHSHFVRNFIGSFTLKTHTALLSLLTSIILARLLGPEGLGIYVYALSIIHVVIFPVMHSFQHLLIREVASYYSQHNYGLISGLIRRADQAAMLIAMSLVILMGGIIWKLAYLLGAQPLTTFMFALILLPLLIFTSVKEAVLCGLRYIILGQFPGSVIRPDLFFVLVAIGSLCFNNKFTASRVMLMQVIATGAALLTSILLLRKRLPTIVKSTSPVFKTKEWINSAWILLLSSEIGIINRKTDIIMLGALKNAAAVGIYRIAQRGAELVAFCLMAVNMTIAPTLSELYTKGEMKKIQQIITHCARLCLIVSTAVAFGLIIFGQWIIFSVFGKEFGPALPPLIILGSAQLVNTATGSVGLLLNMSGHERDTAKGAAIAAILNVMLNALLIPIWSIKGAAIATAISIVTWNFLLEVWVVQRIGIHTTVLGRLT